MLEIQSRVRGQPADNELIVVDGKQPRHGSGESILTALTSPGQFLMGCARVDTKTNEVPVARELFKKMDLVGRTVAMDALHTNEQTARELVMEHGAHYLMTVKGNQPSLRRNIDTAVPEPTADPLAPEVAQRPGRSRGTVGKPRAALWSVGGCRPRTSGSPSPHRWPGCDGKGRAGKTSRSG